MNKYRHSKNLQATLLMIFVCIAGVCVVSIGMHYINKTIFHPRRTVIGKISTKHVERFRPKNGRYIFYRDFTNRQAWVSQRRHGHFAGSVCEAAALETALRLEGLVKHVSLYHFTKNYVGFPKRNGRTSPFASYNRNPYRHHGASVYSQPLARAAEKAGSRAKVIDGTNVKKIINYLKFGHPVYIEAGHEMNPIWHGKISDHTLVLAGIRQDRHDKIQVKYMDPNCNTYRGKATGWCSLKKFLVAWERPRITGERAVVLLGRGQHQKNHRFLTKLSPKQGLAHNVIKRNLKSIIVSKK